MTYCRSLLVEALRSPRVSARLEPADWDVLIRQARGAQLLPRLAVLLEDHELWRRVPEAPARHLRAALEAQRRQRQAVRWEVQQLLTALQDRAVPLVLLKGAAYEMAGLPPARSRLCNDIDILVAREDLKRAELALLMAGWVTEPLDAYDQRYYRRWMHELPPMRHRVRNSIVDVHHNLVPETARSAPPDAALLLASAVPCDERPEVRVLGREDMILHSAVHLFNDGEFDHALRDLLDIDDLVRHFMRARADWQRLTERAVRTNLARPLFYALRYLQRIPGTPVPADTLAALARYGPPPALRPLLDAVFERGLKPEHSTCNGAGTAAARWLLFVRGHFMRMPAHLLLPHLLRKGVLRVRQREAR